MTIKLGPVNPWTQLSLIPDEDFVVAFHVTVHAREGFATISLTAWTEPSDALQATEVAPAVPLHSLEDAVREMGSRFTELLREHSGPFPHQYS